MTEITKITIFNDTSVECYYRHMGQNYHYFIRVESRNPAFPQWEQEFLTTGVPPNTSLLNFCFMVHHKVVKNIRKRMKKSTTRLLRKVKYRKLFDSQDGMCYLCKEPLSVYDCTIDHVTPRSKGGKDSLRNILLTHSKCNTDKADRSPSEQELAYLLEVNVKVKALQYYKYEGLDENGDE